MADKNSIGDRGENIVASRLTEFFIFRECFLGEKYPVADFLFDINDDVHPYPFLVQVKTTSEPVKKDRYNVRNGNIKTPVPTDKLTKLIDRPLPTYVAGVDEVEEIVYIASAYDRNTSYPSIPIRIKLEKGYANNRANLNLLKEDVINYWRGINQDIKHYKESFQSRL